GAVVGGDHVDGVRRAGVVDGDRVDHVRAHRRRRAVVGLRYLQIGERLQGIGVGRGVVGANAIRIAGSGSDGRRVDERAGGRRVDRGVDGVGDVGARGDGDRVV